MTHLMVRIEKNIHTIVLMSYEILKINELIFIGMKQKEKWLIKKPLRFSTPPILNISSPILQNYFSLLPKVKRKIFQAELKMLRSELKKAPDPYRTHHS